MEIAIVLFERITALDAVGPYEVLSRIPGARVRFVAKREGAVRTDDGALGMIADAALSDVTGPEIVLVPGGWGVAELERDEEFLAWVRAVHEKTRLTTSVCTGSLLLGAAGLLGGIDATTHWARVESLEAYGARYLPERIVTSGKIITAAGVSAGIDMALALAATLSNQATAEAIQLSIEYDPAPPFDSGSPRKAAAQVRELVDRRTRDRLGRVHATR